MCIHTAVLIRASINGLASFLNHTTPLPSTMKTAFALLALALFIGTVSAAPQARTSCSIDELLKCQQEINRKLYNIIHFSLGSYCCINKMHFA